MIVLDRRRSLPSPETPADPLEKFASPLISSEILGRFFNDVSLPSLPRAPKRPTHLSQRRDSIPESQAVFIKSFPVRRPPRCCDSGFPAGNSEMDWIRRKTGHLAGPVFCVIKCFSLGLPAGQFWRGVHFD